MTVLEEMVGLPEAEHGVYDDKKAFCVRACSRPMLRREAGSSFRLLGMEMHLRLKGRRQEGLLRQSLFKTDVEARSRLIASLAWYWRCTCG